MLNEPYFDVASKGCMSCRTAFGGKRDYWDPKSQTCVASCAAGENLLAAKSKYFCAECADGYYWNEDKCEPCPADRPEWDSKRRQCVAACPDEKPVLLNGECTSCATFSWYSGTVSLPFWNPSSRKCEAYCDESSPAPDNNNVCRTCLETDPRKPYWDGHRCVSCADAIAGGIWTG